jgi:hypothetical protein
MTTARPAPALNEWDVRVLRAIQRAAHGQPYVDITQNQISDLTDMRPSDVGTCIRYLRLSGYIDVEQPNRHHPSNRYWLHRLDLEAHNGAAPDDERRR